MNTDHLVRALVNDLRPVTPLAPTGRRLFRWLAIGVPFVAVVVVVMGVRPDIGEKLSDATFLFQEFAMAVTALAAAWAALAAGIPGTWRGALYAPVAPLLLWGGAMGYQYAREWQGGDAAALMLGIDLQCIPGIMVTGSVPLLAIIAAIRAVGPQNRTVAVFWGTFASAALANGALRLFHTVDAAIMVIVWQFGSVLAFAVVAAFARNVLVPVRVPSMT
jgi:hypothetical protein